MYHCSRHGCGYGSFKKYNVNIIKQASTADTSEVAASFLGCEPIDKGQDKLLWDACAELAFVRDPDGYLVEMVPISPKVDFVREN